MGSQRLWLVAVLTLSAVGPHSPGVWAQEAICHPGWEWNQNSLGQGPCTVDSALEASCRGVSSYPIPPLGNWTYGSPLTSNVKDLKCKCNTVVYSLYQACTSCQGGPKILSWTTWMTNCSNIYVAQYPYEIPPGTEVPKWAFIDVTTLPNKTYSDAAAMAIARNPAGSTSSVGSSTISSIPPSSSSISSIPPSTSSISFAPPSTLLISLSTSSTSSSASPPTRTSGSPNNVSIIVGGVVGGVVASIVVVVVAVLVYKWPRRGNKARPDSARFLIEQRGSYHLSQRAST